MSDQLPNKPAPQSPQPVVPPLKTQARPPVQTQPLTPQVNPTPSAAPQAQPLSTTEHPPSPPVAETIPIGEQVENPPRAATHSPEVKVSVREPEPVAAAPSGKLPLSLTHFTEEFGPLSRDGKPILLRIWGDVYTPGVMYGLVGQDKTDAKLAAHQQRCWTVTINKGAPMIEAGMNTDDKAKMGYIATQKPWPNLEVSVL